MFALRSGSRCFCSLVIRFWILASLCPAIGIPRQALLESSRPSQGHVWIPDELTRAFSRRRERQAYRYARHTFGRFLQSIGKLAPEVPKPHADVVAAYAQHLKEPCGLAADTITRHAWRIGAFLQ